jgi:hypothetical protein
VGSALRLALAAWGRHPRELGGANAAVFLAAALPLPLMLKLPAGAPRFSGLAVALVWAWVCFNALAFICANIFNGTNATHGLGGWFRDRAPERLAALAAAMLLLAWAQLALQFYLRLGLPLWVGLPVLAILGSLMAWTLMALLLSIGVAALGVTPWRKAWKASALLPLAYAPSALGALLLALLFSGLPAFAVGLKHWSASLLFAPLALSPFFSAAFFAAFLVLLVRGLAETAAGGDGPLAPDWRELWNPWR